jgi:hypothetical protein
VPGRAERNALARIAQVGRNIVVRIKERSEVNKVLGLGNCARAASHGTSMPDDGGTQHAFVRNPAPMTPNFTGHLPIHSYSHLIRGSNWPGKSEWWRQKYLYTGRRRAANF